MYNILVLGANGQLGTEFKFYHNHNFVFTDINTLDILNPDEKIFKEIDIVINCAAYTNVDKAEIEKEKCYNINFRAIKKIVNICNKVNAKLIHFSTDYVYNGNLDEYYEDDIKDPLNFYGISKNVADNYIINRCNNYVIFRISGLYGKFGNNFVYSIFKILIHDKEIYIINDIISCPTYAKDVAKSVMKYINNNNIENEVINLCGNKKISWYDFGEIIKEITKIHNIKLVPVTTEEYYNIIKPKYFAKRPKYSCLNTYKSKVNFISIDTKIENNLIDMLQYMR